MGVKNNHPPCVRAKGVSRLPTQRAVMSGWFTTGQRSLGHPRFCKPDASYRRLFGNGGGSRTRLGLTSPVSSLVRTLATVASPTSVALLLLPFRLSRQPAPPKSPLPPEPPSAPNACTPGGPICLQARSIGGSSRLRVCGVGRSSLHFLDGPENSVGRNGTRAVHDRQID